MFVAANYRGNEIKTGRPRIPCLDTIGALEHPKQIIVARVAPALETEFIEIQKFVKFWKIIGEAATKQCHVIGS